MSETLNPVVSSRADAVRGLEVHSGKPLVSPPGAPADAPDGAECARCAGTGMVDTYSGLIVCGCPAGERYWHRVSRMAGVPSCWRALNLRTYAAVSGPSEAVQVKAFRQAYEWALKVWFALRKGQPEPRGLLLYGVRGAGKSTLAAAVANSLLRARLSVEWMNVPRLYLEALRAQQADEGVLGLIDRLAHADVLILDDIGAEKASDYAQSVLYNVLEDRANRGRLLLATSNLSPYVRTPDNALTELEARIGERNASRLLGLCRPVAMAGEDLRLQK